METPVSILTQYWGHTSFRPLQEDIINACLAGNDVLALLPTGGGKSICFQVPALCQPGICLVISPLIALMKDQVQNLHEKGIPALLIHSGMAFMEVRKTLEKAASGQYKFLYVSPERVETNQFLEFLPAMQINLIAVDEAHCISQWGYDFRPSYTNIAALRTQLPHTPVLALTASATRTVQLDIMDKLSFKDGYREFQQSFERPNLSYSVFEVAARQTKLVEILKKVPGSALVYCKSRKATKAVADLLNMHQLNASYYHAGLSSEERSKRQEDWINNTTRIMACTNAFGMGIDKPDVRVVVHYEVPDSLENYYQEAGRAGRDGKRSFAVLLYHSGELEALQQQSAIRYPDKDSIKQVYIAVMNHLQVAAGNGEGWSADFDLSHFCKTFNLDLLTVTYALKTLEQEGILRYSDNFFKPSSLVFTADKTALNELEQHYPTLEPIVKGLLRSYEGIIDFPSTIYETQLARFMRTPIQQIKQDLKQLQGLGIVRYTPQKETPQLQLLLNRMYADSFQINLAAHLARKACFEERVNAMVAYVNNASSCRSAHIAAYFNDHQTKPCGSCDNCIQLKKQPLDKASFEQWCNLIVTVIEKNQPIAVLELLNELKAISTFHLWEILNYLQSEKSIQVKNEAGRQMVWLNK